MVDELRLAAVPIGRDDAGARRAAGDIRAASPRSPDAAGVAAPVSLIRKDVWLALDLAAAHDLQLPVAESVAAGLDGAVAAGLAEQDMARVLTALRAQTGRMAP